MKSNEKWFVGEPIRNTDTLGINVKWQDGDESGEETIAEVLPGCGPAKMLEQANLIAAAPDLLTFAQDIKYWLTSPDLSPSVSSPPIATMQTLQSLKQRRENEI